MRFYAHRGLSKRYKDNSVESIREAIYENYDGVEIDVQLSKDYEIVLFHDLYINCLLYTSPSPRDRQKSRMPSSA